MRMGRQGCLVLLGSGVWCPSWKKLNERVGCIIWGPLIISWENGWLMIMLKLDRGCRCSSDPEEIKPELRDFVGIFFRLEAFSFFFRKKKFFGSHWYSICLFRSFTEPRALGWTCSPQPPRRKGKFWSTEFRQVCKRHPSPNPPGKCLETVRFFVLFFLGKKIGRKIPWIPS